MNPPKTLDLQHESIMASAGSGKTFQLTNRYLRLLLEGAEPGTILASTFTRKAAGEIRDRVLSRLAEAIVDDSSREELARFIGPQARNRDALLDALARLAQSMHRLQVRTLDSFFAGIVRCFSLELGIDPAAEIVEEETARQMQLEAVRLMLNERDPQPLINLLRALTADAYERPVTESIHSVVSNLYELFREAEPGAWTAIEPIDGILETDELLKAITTLEAHVPDVGDQRFAKAHASDCATARTLSRLHAESWFEWLNKGLAGRVRSGATTYYNKVISPDVIAAYQPLVNHGRAVVRRTIIERTRATRDLLERFHAQYEHLKRTRKALTFADLTNLVSQAETLGTLPEICFRLDATLHHVLLDEMQDTSIIQWRALLPFVEEIISHRPPERSFFAVGDVKQSIYGWREACPEILESIPNMFTGPDGTSAILPHTLPENYRSSPVVIEFVNSVFGDIRANRILSDYPQARDHWSAIFDKHVVVKTQKPGRVTLRTARRAEDGEKQRSATLEDAATSIATLHGAIPHTEIGVLTRTNAAVHELLYRLGPGGRRLSVSGRGGGALTDAPPVNVILDLLRLVDHPDHSIAAFNVAHSLLGSALGLKSDANAQVSREACSRLAGSLRRRLHEAGYASLIREWIRHLAPQADHRELQRLAQLEEIAIRFDRQPTLRCDDFINLARASNVEEPGGAPIQVMTIHQSKGLEFDIVVLPDLENDLVRTNNVKVIAERRSPTGPVTRIAQHVKTDYWRLFDDLAPMLEQFQNAQARESLAMLYVALTRARSALHMFIAPPPTNERTIRKSMAGLLRVALGAEQIEPASLVYESGDPEWHRTELVETMREARPARTASIRPVQLPHARGRVPRGRVRRAASRLGHTGSTLASRLAPPAADALTRGTAIHALFERIEWIDAFAPDPDALAAHLRALDPRFNRQWIDEQVQAFFKMIQQPEICAALTRPDEPGVAVRLERELPFARLVDGAVQQGYIDRLVLRMRRGVPVRASVLDYKTDAVDAESMSARVEDYQTQMAEYRDAAADLYGLDATHIEMKLLFVVPGRVITLQPAAHDHES